MDNSIILTRLARWKWTEGSDTPDSDRQRYVFWHTGNNLVGRSL